MHPEPDLTTISATLMALFEHAEMAKEAKDEAADSYDDDDDRDLADSEVSEAKYNYPDLDAEREARARHIALSRPRPKAGCKETDGAETNYRP